ncbi:MAG TPA: tRNA dihydrouridine synthase DusB [Tepidisphaeraceae bacterium]|jgi:nifR3 family TIM-barrel protein|nr:tRNA dihydrouridine synthase DusB [Tepidisphaeraceae bacterium]
MNIAPIKIDNVQLSTNLLLAPIAGYCDLSFRLIARSCGGLGLACTDLLCPEGVLRENRKSMELAATCPEDWPIAMQLYGGDVEKLCDAARWAEDRGAHVIDINMGCPVDKITKRDGGSKLLCDPDKTMGMVEKIVRVLKHTPLTAKMRLGWDDTCIVAPKLAARLENAGIAMVTIHGRTTAMRFSGEARLDGIAEVVAAVKRIPVIGNGDVRSPQDAERMMQYTKCAGVMIGRAALSRPWIFRDTWSYLTTGTIPPPPSIEQKCELIRRHFYNLIQHRSERAAVCEFRKRVSWYAKEMNPCRILRDEMRAINSPADFDNVLQRFLDWRLAYDENPGANPFEAGDDLSGDAVSADKGAGIGSLTVAAR